MSKRGMTDTAIKNCLSKKINEWIDSIDDESVRNLVRNDAFVAGGAIASMLLGDEVNDYDVYFASLDAAESIAKYYLKKAGIENVRIRRTTDNVSILVSLPGWTGAESADAGPYHPVFVSSSAISLSGGIQLCIPFVGDPHIVVREFDFAHSESYWRVMYDELYISPDAMRSLLAKELVYTGSKYPLSSLMRVRKFLERGYSISAGQLLKIACQINELRLYDETVLQEQLVGVDIEYFSQFIKALKGRDETIDYYLITELVEEIF